METKDPLDRLLGAAWRGRDSESLEMYRACYEIGPPLIPQITEKIRAVDWKGPRAVGQLLYLTVLMRLLHDIDESASRELTGEILGKGCHSAVAARLRSIQVFTLENFETQAHGALIVYVAKALSRKEAVWPHLKTWLDHVPAEDLADIPRLYVIEDDRELGFWGQYLKVLSVVSLVWRPSQPWNPLAALRTEFTLYHEIGHHVHRGMSGPKESEEAFADTYAQRMFRSAHPKLGKRWTEMLIVPSHLRRKIRRARRLIPRPPADV